ncbi:THxN family PEP-CTERM protein [Rheinheimera metallidurans]|uniref:THxN family PEP-CTERM protein n=1 Tax=Rheinheimera metallidurans TaxID=2925781 RepID=UPI0030018649
MKSRVGFLVTALGSAALLACSASVSAAAFSITFETSSGWLADGLTYDGYAPKTRQKNGVETIHNCAAGATNALNGCGLEFYDASAGINDAYTSVNWGTPRVAGQPSGLDIVSYNGVLDADAGWVDTGMITHRNRQVVAGTKTLAELNLFTMFDIVSPFMAQTGSVFGINFTETFNDQGGYCNPDIQFSTTPCDDYFNISGIPVPITFTFGGQKYVIEFRLWGDVNTGFVIDDNMLRTAENSDNNLFVQARLVTVPEPATIAVLGLGLLMLSGRRKKA